MSNADFIKSQHIMRCDKMPTFVFPELGLEGQLSPEDLGTQWEHSLHELSPQVKKCDGAESATLRLKDLGIPQVI